MDAPAREMQPSELSADARAAAARESTLDHAAFYRANVDRAWRIAWRLTGGDHAAAEDIVQDAFVKAFRGLAQFRGDAAPETWFFRIVTNEAKNHLRWRGVRTLWGALWNDETADPAAAAAPDAGLRRELVRAIGSLSRGQREAFVLVRLEEFSVRDAAAVLGVAEGTIKAQLARATKRLRDELEPVWEELQR